VLAIREATDYTDEVVVDRVLALADGDPDIEVRRTAISSLGNFVYLGATTVYELEMDAIYAEDLLAEADYRRVYDFLLSLYRDEGRTLDERRYAVESLSYASDETVEGLIAELYARPEKEAKVSALFAMGCSGSVRWEETLRDEFYNSDSDLQIEAIHAAGEMGADDLGKDLWRLTYDEDRDVVMAAVWALGQTGWDGAFDRLDELTLDEDPQVRECADEAMEEWLFYNGLAQDQALDEPDTFLDEEEF
jgi:HEAT repeat protein